MSGHASGRARATAVVASSEPLEPRLLFAATDLDPSFNGTGKRVLDFAGQSDTARAVAVQADGKIVVAGDAAAQAGGRSVPHFAVVRLNANGTLDDGSAADATPGDRFGTAGRVRVATDDESYAWQVAVRPDGKILLAGVSRLLGATGGPYTSWRFMRLNRDGSLDPTFGTNGTTRAFTTAGSLELRGMVLQPDGRFVAAGAMNGDVLVARFTPGGSLDPTFSGDGWATVDLGDFYNRAAAVALDHLGRIVVGGQGYVPTNNTVRLGAVRFLPNGSLDPRFDGDGKALAAGPQPAYSTVQAQAVAVRRDGKVFVCGIGTTFAGSAYALFDDDGRSRLTSFGGTVFSPLTSAVTTRQDRFMVGGGGWFPTATESNFAFDSGNGSGEADFGGFDVGYAMAVAPNGRVVQVGYTNADGTGRSFAVAAYVGVRPAAYGAVAGSVFRDTDGDGVRDPGEGGVADVRVYVDANNDGAFADMDANDLYGYTGERSARTDAAGNYTIPGLNPGPYRVRYVLPAGWERARPAGGYHDVILAGGQTAAGRAFGVRPADPDDTVAEANSRPANTIAIGGRADLTIDHPMDVDVLKVTVSAGTRLAFDLDPRTGSGALNPYLRLFTAGGVELAANDNAPAPGEAAGVWSYLTYTFRTAGTYYVAVSTGANRAFDVLAGTGDLAGGATGAYALLVRRV